MINKQIVSGVNWVLVILVGLVSFCAGLFAKNFSQLEIDNKIRLANIATIAISGGVALYIASFLKKKQDIEKEVKSIVTEQLKELIKKVDELSQMLEEETLATQKTNSLLKDMNLQVLLIKEFCATSSFSESSIKLQSLSDKREDLWTLITGGETKSGKFQLSDQHMASAKSKTFGLKKEILSIIVAISKS